ncbi:MAG TPA: hypothetical protein VFF67_09940 [Thermoplasmata archaeon]|nr:hypothetical protein [Thermoplasmata archaeon]
MPETRNYTIKGDPEEMLRGLKGALPSLATLSGDSTRGNIMAPLFGTIISFSRTGDQLNVTVHRSVLGYTVPQIWGMIERGLGRFL